MARKDKRVAAAVQFTPGKDDDLITWHRNIPEGERNQRLKAAIRAGMGAPMPKTASAGEVERLRAEWSEWTATLLEQLPGYVQNVLQEVLRNYAPVAPTETTITEAPRLSEDDKRERAARMKKANW
jgi:hypothetical protein